MPRRKPKNYHYIYKTTNLLNGKYYIGMHSSHSLNDGYMGSGKRLRYSINKYGSENHQVEILEYLNSRGELKEREKEIVNFNEISKKECMNLKIGGEGGNIGPNGEVYGGDRCKAAIEWIRNPKNRKKLQEITRKSGLKQWSNRTEKEKDKFIQDKLTFRDLKHSQETKEKIGEKSSLNQKGKKNSQFGSRWITNGKENKKIKKKQYIESGWKLGRI